LHAHALYQVDLVSLDLVSLDLLSVALVSLTLLSLAFESLALVSVLLSAVDSLLESELALGLLDEYRSEYQPLPFNTKPVPPETCRRAVALPQLGQSFSAASRIDWVASHVWLQVVQTYS
jgi:hypothetical protein